MKNAPILSEFRKDKTMKIDVKGHSGCSVDIVREGSGLYIKKSTSSTGYFSRLIAQARKQQAASRRYRSSLVKVPEILDISRTRDRVSVKMNYIYSMNFVEYFEYSGFYRISHFIDMLKSFLMEEVALSPMTCIGRGVLVDKFKDVRTKCISNPLINGDDEIAFLLERSARIFMENKDDFTIPVGVCHGDLTFSNILFSNGDYYLIDFLDSFVESPLMDIVKVRQDTAFGWSLLMYGRLYDEIRLKIIFEKIDIALDDCFSQYEWYQRYYPVFQLMNFLRILQYAKDSRVVEYLKTVMKRLTDEF
mgnify:CR=1 FL=1